MDKKVLESKATQANQKFTSKDTSINSKKLPAIYKMIAGRVTENDTVIDYGCGKYFDSYNLPSNYHGYDPYNRPNEEELDIKYNVAICSNVLNVIMERECRLALLNNLKNLANKVFITVYEGNRSGKGSQTKKDCFQLNRMRGDYIPELIEVFGYGNVRYNRKGYFECWSEEGAVV